MQSKMLIIGLVILTAILACPVFAGQTKYASGTTSATVTFGANPYSAMNLTAILASTDNAGSLALYSSAAKAKPTSAASSNGVTIAVGNSAYTFTNNDLVVYQWANGTVLQSTVTNATATNIIINTALTYAGSTNDAVYKVTQSGGLTLPTTGVAICGYVVATAPPDSPLVIKATGATNACSVTGTVTP